MSHIFDNITKSVLRDLSHFDSYQQSLRVIVDLLSIKHYRARLLDSLGRLSVSIPF